VTGELGFSGLPGLGLLGSSGSRETCRNKARFSSGNTLKKFQETVTLHLWKNWKGALWRHMWNHAKQVITSAFSKSPSCDLRSAQISPVTAAEGRLLLPKP